MSRPGDGRVRPVPTVVWTEVDGVVFVANSAAPEPFVVRALEGTAATIWQLLQDEPTEEMLASRIADEYGVDVTEIAPELRRFIVDLRAGRLVAAED